MLPQSAARVFTNSVAISYEVLGAEDATIQPLATVKYDPKSLEYVLSSWTPPLLDDLKSSSKQSTSSPLVRISSEADSTTVTGLSTFDRALSQDINIWLSQDGEVISTSITSRTPPPLSKEERLHKEKEERLRARGKSVPSKNPEKSLGKKAKNAVVGERPIGPTVSVDLRRVSTDVRPRLTARKPLEVNEHGQEVEGETEQEKTFFQKYWYWLLIGGFLLVSSVGGG